MKKEKWKLITKELKSLIMIKKNFLNNKNKIDNEDQNRGIPFRLIDYYMTKM